MYLIFGLIYQIKYGRLRSVFLEFGIAMVFNAIKSMLTQLIIYWVVIRRCGMLQINPEFNGKWNDDTIFAGGIDLSLFSLLRKKTADFIEHIFISNLILGMTVFLCIVILSELSVSEYIDTNEWLAMFYF